MTDDTTIARPKRWLVVQSTALLESVATSNYACYGRQGVPRYPIPAPTQADPAQPVLCVELHISDPEGATRLALLDLELVQHEQSARRAMWQMYDAGRRMQVIWVWDFYRILSSVVIRFGLPDAGQASDALWQSVLDAARMIEVQDVITLKVRSRCGSIDQRHTITDQPHEWEPESTLAQRKGTS